jgi:hypothetical protein
MRSVQLRIGAELIKKRQLRTKRAAWLGEQGREKL